MGTELEGLSSTKNLKLSVGNPSWVSEIPIFPILPVAFFSLFWLHWLLVAMCGLSLVRVSRAYSLVVVWGLLIAMASLVAEHRLSVSGSVVVAHGFSCPVACIILVPWARNPTHALCIGRWVLNHWTTREVPWLLMFDLRIQMDTIYTPHSWPVLLQAILAASKKKKNIDICQMKCTYLILRGLTFWSLLWNFPFPLKFTCVHFYFSHCGMCSSRFSMFQSSHSYTLDL